VKTLHEAIVVLGVMAGCAAYMSPRTWDAVREVQACALSLCKSEQTWTVVNPPYGAITLRGRYVGRDEFGQVKLAISSGTIRFPLAAFTPEDQKWIEAQHETKRR